MADFKSTVNDPVFIYKSRPVQIEILSQIDPNFAKLSDMGKNEVIDASVPKPERQSIWGDMPSIIGGMAGGMAKTVAGRTGLSALLAAAGEGLHQIYQGATGSELAPKTTGEAVERMAFPAGEQALGGLVGEGIVKGVSKVLPKVIPEFRLPGLKESEEALRPYMEQYLPKGMLSKHGGPGFTIAQKANPASSAAKMENIIESSFFGETPIKRF